MVLVLTEAHGNTGSLQFQNVKDEIWRSIGGSPSLVSSNAPRSVVLQSSRHSLQTVPQPDTDVYSVHAVSSAIYHTLHTGTVLLHVIHGGLIVELISLSTPVPPIRFVFPAPVLSTPVVCAWGEQELHLLAVTITGSLYRLVLSTTNPSRLWHDEAARNWCREYIIKNVSDLSGSIAHVQGPHGVAIGLGNGSLLGVEVQRLGDTTSDASRSRVSSDLWTETVTVNRRHFWVYALAQTRRQNYFANVTSSNKPVLLSGGARNLLRVYPLSPNGEKAFAVVFTPTPDDPHCGGYFQIMDSSSDQLHELRTIECSTVSTNACHLEDFFLENGSLTAVNDSEWETSNYGEEIDLTPAYLDEVLLAPGSLTEKFMEPWSNTSMRAFLYQALLPELTTSYTSVAENIAAVVGCTVTLVQDPHTGAIQYDRYWSALKRDWEGFIARCRDASSIFREKGLTQHEVGFLQLALSVASPETNIPDLWYGLIHGYIDLGFWEEAYSAMIATPFDGGRRECISQLVYRVCEENAVEGLISLNFAGFSCEVDDALAFKACNTDPPARTSYLLAINSLSLLEEKKAWFVVQTLANNVHELESRKRRKLIQNLPSCSAGDGSEIIDLHALRFDHAFLSAKKHLVCHDPTLLAAPGTFRQSSSHPKKFIFVTEALLSPPLVF
ncbi:hypothetical protein EDD15DRAFT_2204738 [Pisolithus albus]|nr:hypothetical protein EDD15DRAFT_2204738 [Pisolithus albus]